MSVAADIARKFDKSVVIIICHDPVYGLMHTTTYGRNEQEKEWAAQGGEIANRALGGMPEIGTHFEDYRVSRMARAENALRAILALPNDEEIREAQHIARKALEQAGKEGPLKP